MHEQQIHEKDALLVLVVEWIRELESPSPRAVFSQISPLVSNIPNDSVTTPHQLLPLL